MKQAHKTLAFWLFIVLLCLLLLAVVQKQGARTSTQLPWSEFIAHFEAGEVARMTIAGEDQVTGELKDGSLFSSRGPVDKEPSGRAGPAQPDG